MRGWTGRTQIETNLAMLRNIVAPLTGEGSALEHVTLLQGTKAYGVHHGSYKIPARESDPRFIAPNFYYDQEDFLRARPAVRPWSFTVLRPQIVCGFALSNPMNALTAIGVYAAVRRGSASPSASRAVPPATRRPSTQACWPGPFAGPDARRAATGRSTTSPTATCSAGSICGRASPGASAWSPASRTASRSPRSCPTTRRFGTGLSHGMACGPTAMTRSPRPGSFLTTRCAMGERSPRRACLAD